MSLVSDWKTGLTSKPADGRKDGRLDGPGKAVDGIVVTSSLSDQPRKRIARAGAVPHGA